MKNTVDDAVYKARKKRFIGLEFLFWIFATGMGLFSAFAASSYVTQVMELSRVKLVVAVASTLVLSLTWGSWAALLWTRRKGMRTLIYATTQLPSVWILLIAGALVYSGLTSLPLIIALVAASGALFYTNRHFTRRVRALTHVKSSLSALALALIHPLITGLITATFLFFWLNGHDKSMLTPIDALITLVHQRVDLLELLFKYTYLVVLGISVIASVIPAMVSDFLSRFLISKDEL